MGAGSERRADGGILAESEQLGIVALHGALGGPADWSAVEKALGAGESRSNFEAPELWDFDGSLPDVGAQLAQNYASDLLVGYSMGGRMALHSLLTPAATWKAAVIVSAHCGLENEDDRATRRSSDEEWAEKLLGLDPAEFWSDWQSQPVFAGGTDRDSWAPDAPTRERMAKGFRDWSLGAQESLLDGLRNVDIPVIWVAGENDPKFLRLARRACDAMPNGHLLVAPGSGHRVPWDSPETVALAIEQALLLITGTPPEDVRGQIGHEMVRASAGTGKTTSLTRRYVRLLAMGAKPETIVALTFTRKAAGEFFDRIAEMLAEASGDAEKAAKLREDIGLDRKFEADFPRLLREVLSKQHVLMLGTLDSFYSRVVRSFPFELGVAGGFQVLDGYALDVERERALAGVFERVEQRSGGALAAFLQAFKNATHGREEVLLNRLLAEYVANFHRILLNAPETMRWGDEYAIWGDSGVPYPKANRKQLEILKEEFYRALGANPIFVDEPRMEKWNEALDFLIQRPPGTALGSDRFLINNLLPMLPAVREGAAIITVNRKKCALDPMMCQKLWAFFAGVLGEEIRVRLVRAAGMQQLLKDFEKIYHGTVRARGALTFDDLARLLGDIAASRHGGELQPISVAMGYRLDATFDHWLLDEFQDTSRVQWAALADLIDEVVQDDSDQRSLFVVGDTKQAIYGWREGDARLFGEVLERYNRGAEDRIKEGALDESYRSAKPVIETVNRVFGDRESMAQLFVGSAVDRWSWKTHSAAFDEAQRPGHVELLESCPAGVGASQFDKSKREQARLGLVADRLQQIRPGEKGISCAILVKGNAFADRAVDFLRDRCPELEFSTESSRKIAHENHLCSALFSLVQVAGHPGDSLAWRHLEMTPLAKVFATRELDGRHAVAADVLRDLESLGFAATLQKWIDALGEVVELDDFASMRGAQLVEAAGAFDRSGGSDPTAFLAALERYEIRDAGGARTVQIMTVHKAKGLDFDMVILPDLDGDSLGGRDRTGGLLVGRGDRREIEWAIEPPAGKLLPLDPVLAAQKESSLVDEVYEGFCRLYVGMTRPRHGLYMIVDKPSASSVKKGVYPSTFAGWLRLTLGEAAADDDSEALVRSGIGCRTLFDLGDVGWPEHPVVREKTSDETPRASLDRIVPQADSRVFPPAPSSPSRQSLVQADYSEPRANAAAFGTAVHACLETIDWLAADTAATLAKAAAFEQEVVEEVQQCLQAAPIQSLLTKPTTAVELWQERPFDVLVDGQWISGILDRVHLHRSPDGSVASAEVLDFKTDRVKDGRLDDACTDHAPQIHLYRYAVATLLGIDPSKVGGKLIFTHHGQVREVVAEM